MREESASSQRRLDGAASRDELRTLVVGKDVARETPLDTHLLMREVSAWLRVLEPTSDAGRLMRHLEILMSGSSSDQRESAALFEASRFVKQLAPALRDWISERTTLPVGCSTVHQVVAHEDGFVVWAEVDSCVPGDLVVGVPWAELDAAPHVGLGDGVHLVNLTPVYLPDRAISA